MQLNIAMRSLKREIEDERIARYSTKSENLKQKYSKQENHLKAIYQQLSESQRLLGLVGTDKFPGWATREKTAC